MVPADKIRSLRKGFKRLRADIAPGRLRAEYFPGGSVITAEERRRKRRLDCERHAGAFGDDTKWAIRSDDEWHYAYNFARQAARVGLIALSLHDAPEPMSRHLDVSTHQNTEPCWYLADAPGAESEFESLAERGLR